MKRVEKEHRKVMNTLIIRGAWIICKHRIACVLKGAAPSITSILREFKDEQSLVLSGAKKLQGLELGVLCFAAKTTSHIWSPYEMSTGDHFLL
jgi:hypothetical protein